jgi:mannobiose 2-epimerase
MFAGVTTQTDRLAPLRDGMERDLRDNVLPFWLVRVLDERRGFHGFVSDLGAVNPHAPMGSVLCARLLWTFSAAFRAYGDPSHRRAADHFYAWLTRRFLDAEHGGVFWMLDAGGLPIEDRKQTYAVAFAVYALAEYHLATGSPAALECAIGLRDAIEAHAADRVHPGYFEARARDWSVLEDVRLSEKDQNAPKSMNTHLHVMEAYANLLRAWGDERLRSQLCGLVTLHLERIVDPATGHLFLFFDEAFSAASRGVSFGHDVEASWLIVEAARLVGDTALLSRARTTALRMARAVLDDGFDREHGGVFAERGEDGRLDDDKHWWMQAEAVVGFVNAYELSGDEAFLAAAAASWRFCERFLVDREHGEWRWRVRRDGTPIAGLPKVEPWKCPYHNSRAALETAARVTRILG